MHVGSEETWAPFDHCGIGAVSGNLPEIKVDRVWGFEIRILPLFVGIPIVFGAVVESFPKQIRIVLEETPIFLDDFRISRVWRELGPSLFRHFVAEIATAKNLVGRRNFPEIFPIARVLRCHTLSEEKKRVNSQMSQKRKYGDHAAVASYGKKPKTTAHDERRRKLPAVLQGSFRNLFYQTLRWIAPDLLVEAMEVITQRLFHETPNFLHPFTVISPCAYTRKLLTQGIVQTLQQDLCAQHRRIMFEAPKSLDQLNGVLATSRKEIEGHVRTWCQEINKMKPNRIEDHGEGIITKFPPILIIEVPDAESYTARDLDFSLKVVRETILKVGVPSAHILLLISIDLYSEQIQALADEWNPSNTMVSPVPPPSPYDPDSDDEPDEQKQDEEEEEEHEQFTTTHDVWRFLGAREQIEALHARHNRFPTMVIPFPAMSQSARAYEYRTRLQEHLDKVMPRFSGGTKVDVRVPFYVGFVLADMYPATNPLSLISLTKFFESAASKIESACQDIHQEFRGERRAPAIDRCHASINANAVVFQISDSPKLQPAQKLVHLPLPKNWDINRELVLGTQSKIEEAKISHHFQISDLCKEGISANVGVIARNTPNADTLAVAEITKFALPGSLISYNPEFCMISQQSVTGRLDLDFAWAVGRILSRHDQELAENKAQLERLEGKVRQLEQTQIQERKAQQAIAERQELRPGPTPGKGGIYAKYRKGQVVGYSIQYCIGSRIQYAYVGRFDMINHGVDAKKELLRQRALGVGLDEEAIQRSFSRLGF